VGRAVLCTPKKYFKRPCYGRWFDLQSACFLIFQEASYYLFGLRVQRRFTGEQTMTKARTLLAEYVSNGSDAAFRELVGRYVGLVYSTALRRVGGDRHLAEDIAQTVFVDLARKARSFSEEVMLGGWLHRHTCHVADTVLRGERRRQLRERQSMDVNSPQESSESALVRIAPVLDEAIGLLGEEDRHAILLRFFEQRDFRAVGEAMGTREDAARMRVGRALDKLHALLVRRGVSISLTGLGAVLVTETIAAAPAGLAASIATAALAGGTAAGVTSGTLFKLMLMTKIKAAVVSAVVVAGLATPLVMSYNSQAKLRSENQSLRDQIAQLGQVASENEQLSNRVKEAEASRVGAASRELLKLRGEVGALKRQLAESAKAQAQWAQQVAQTNQPATAEDEEKQKAIMRQQFIARMGYARNWILAFHMYAEKNEGRFPADFGPAASLLSDNAKDETLLATNQFEILYHGSIKALTDPANVIVLRENQSTASPSGGWVRTYGFADGHSEVHKSDDGNFQTWEAQRLVALPGDGQTGQ
jgi:RNA polymerase sigma factor (sigma-70 family)